MHHNISRRGFTLMELMIVVAIIFIILAIAVPKYNNARMQANELSAIRMLAWWALVWPVVIIPHALVDEVIVKTEEVVSTETDMRRALVGGMDPVEAYNKYGKF